MHLNLNVYLSLSFFLLSALTMCPIPVAINTVAADKSIWFNKNCECACVLCIQKCYVKFNVNRILCVWLNDKFGRIRAHKSKAKTQFIIDILLQSK